MKLRFISVLLLVFTLLTPAIGQQAITYRSPEVLNPLPLGKPSAIFAANDGSGCLVLQDLDPNEVWRKVSADLVEVTKPTIPFRLGLTTYKVLTVTSQGNVITDKDGISIYSPLGERLQTITFGANGGALLGVDGATVLPDGRTVVLVDNRLQVFSANGTFVTTWGNGKGTGAGFLDVIGTDWSPGLLVSDSKGNVYVSDKNNRRISKWSVTGNFVGAIKLDNLSNPIFWSTGQLAVDANDSIYCVDKNQSCIVKVSAQLSLLWKVSTVGAVDSTLRAPAGVAVLGSSVFVSEAMSHRISKYSTDGLHKSSNRSLVYLPTWPIAGSSWVDIPDSSLHFANFTNPDVNQVSRISIEKKSAWVTVPTIDNASFVQFRNGAGQRFLRAKNNGVSYSLEIYSTDAKKIGSVALGYTRSGNGNGSTWAISDGTTIATVDSTGAILASRSSDGVAPWANIVACATLSTGQVIAIDYDRSALLLLSSNLQLIKSTSFSELGLSKGIRLAVGSDDTVFILGYLAGDVKVVNRVKADFTFIQQIRLTGVNQDYLSLNGLDVGPDFSLVVTDPEGHQVYYYSADTTPPISTLSLSSTANDLGWINSSVLLQLQASDGLGWGVKSVYYQIDSGAIVETPGNRVDFQISIDGLHTVKYWSVDSVNNVEVSRTKSLKLDKAPPITSLSEVGDNIVLSSADTTSGVRGTYYKIDGGVTTSYIGPIPANFGTISYWSDDLAGNTESQKPFLRQPKLASLEVSPLKVVGGGNFLVRIKLESVANHRVYSVTFTSDAPTYFVNMPAFVTVPQGQSIVEFTIQTIGVSALKNVTLTAAAYGITKSLAVQILPPSITSLSMSPTAIPTNSSSVARVTLNGVAPVGGLPISIGGTGPIRVPASVTVVEGQDQATFLVDALATTSIAVAEVRVTFGTQTIKNNINIFPYDLIKWIAEPTSIVGGETTTLSAEISAPAGASGATLQVSSSNGSIVTVPTSLVIPAGQSKGSVQLTSKPVRSDQVVDITATGPISKRKVSITVLAPRLSSMTFSPDGVIGGQTTSLKLSISSKAPVGGLVINLSSDSNEAGVPQTAFIPDGLTSATINISTSQVSSDSLVTLTATLNGQTLTASLKVFAPRVKQIEVTPSQVYGGNQATLKVTLDSVAVEPISVAVTSSNTSLIVPTEVVIPAGTNSASVSVDTVPVDIPQNVSVSGQRFDTAKSTSVVVLPSAIKAISITPNRILGGDSTSLRLELTCPVGPAGKFFGVTVNVQGVTVPAEVYVLPGLSVYEFTINTTEVVNITKCKVTITSVSELASSSFEIMPPKLGILTSDQKVIEKPITGKVTLTLNAPFSTDVKIGVASNNPAIKLQSSTLTFKKGKISGVISYTTLPVTMDQDCELKCTYLAREASTTVTLLAPRPIGMTLKPSSVVSGKPSVCTINIGYASPKDGIRLSLASSDVSAVVPSFVLVPSGKTTATFTITTSKVTTSKNVVITASANGVSKTATLGVRILTVASITFNPTSVQGGVKANGLLTLTDVAPLGGMTVTLSSDKAGVSVPTSVVVPAGKNSVAFVASTSVTGSSYDATITGTANGETGSGTLKVLAPAVSSFALSSTSVKGGDKPLGTVKIAKASTVDVVVSLSSSNAAVASVPATIMIPKGQLLATFQVTTTKPSAATSVTLSATTGGLAKVVVLKVSP